MADSKAMRILLSCLLVPLATVSMSGGTVATASAQAAPPAEEASEDGAERDAPIEWNFRPVTSTSRHPEAALRERWAAPFAVVSRGRPVAREPREVVVLRDSGEPRPAPPPDGDDLPSGDAPEEQEVATTAPPERSGPARSPVAPRASGERSAPAVAAPRTHRVAYGETWYGLARQYRVSPRDLATANPNVDPERLRAGTVLRIPAGGDARAPRTHTVSRGDTLFGIARRYGVSVAALRSANRLTDDIVRLGQTLVIPAEEGSR